MEKQLISLFIIWISGFGDLPLQGQAAWITTGRQVTNNQGSVDYSVGQLFFTTTFTSPFSVWPGVQQPAETTLTFTQNFGLDVLLLKVFPNPAYEAVRIYFEPRPQESFLMSLYNLQGQLLMAGKITSNQELTLSSLEPGIYLLRISASSGDFRTYKVNKL